MKLYIIASVERHGCKLELDWCTEAHKEVIPVKKKKYKLGHEQATTAGRSNNRYSGVKVSWLLYLLFLNVPNFFHCILILIYRIRIWKCSAGWKHIISQGFLTTDPESCLFTVGFYDTCNLQPKDDHITLLLLSLSPGNWGKQSSTWACVVLSFHIELTCEGNKFKCAVAL